MQMWDRYGGSEESVALVSTLGRLREAVPERVDVGHVDYIDFTTEQFFTSNPGHRAFLKVRELEDEREVRGVIVDWPQTGPDGRWTISIDEGQKNGYYVPVDLARLLQRVVVSPNSPEIVAEVASALRRHALHAEVCSATLSRIPMY